MRELIGLDHYEMCKNKECEQYRKMEKEGSSLPDDIFPTELGSYRKIIDSDLSEDEEAFYLKLKQAQYIKTTKNCVLFFTVVYIVTLAIGLLFLLAGVGTTSYWIRELL